MSRAFHQMFGAALVSELQDESTKATALPNRRKSPWNFDSKSINLQINVTSIECHDGTDPLPIFNF